MQSEEYKVYSITFKDTRLSEESSFGKSQLSRISISPSISEPSLLLVLPSDPVDVIDNVESLPQMLGLDSKFLKNKIYNFLNVLNLNSNHVYRQCQLLYFLFKQGHLTEK